MYSPHDLEHDAAHAPDVHLVGVEAVGEEALGRAVPASRDVLGVRLLRVDTATRAEVCQLQQVVLEKDHSIYSQPKSTSVSPFILSLFVLRFTVP